MDLCGYMESACALMARFPNTVKPLPEHSVEKPSGLAGAVEAGRKRLLRQAAEFIACASRLVVVGLAKEGTERSVPPPSASLTSIWRLF